jgi:hypothetical protein
VQYVWLAIIAVSLGPVALVGFFANPLVFILLGPEGWRDRMARLHPYRWWLVFSVAVCAFATAVYAVKYG